MKKTITLSLLFAAATCCYAETPDNLVDLSFTSGPITMSSTEAISVNVSGETKDNLISSTLPEDVSDETVLGRIEFTISTTFAGTDNVTFGTQQNILSIMSTTGTTTGTAYGVSVVYKGEESEKGGSSYHYGYLVLNVGSQTKGDEDDLIFMDTRTYNASITMVANGATAADGVKIILEMGDKSIEFSTTEALTGSFSDIVVGGGQAVGTVSVTSVRTHKTVAESKDDAVPEPTTATLSLLALAGLAARRRRK